MDGERAAAARRVATRQFGYLGRRQAAAIGADRWWVKREVAAGRWRLPTPRVIELVGVPDDPRRPLALAALDGGSGTFVGRRAAAALWAVPGYPYGPVELTREKSVRSRPPSIGTLYTVRYLPPHLTTTVSGIPVVSLPYLLFQLAGFEHPDRAERIVANVSRRSPGVLLRLHQLLPELAERGRDGIVVMRDILRERPVGSVQPESGLERRFEQILVEAGERPLRRQPDLGGDARIGRIDDIDDPTRVLFEVDSEIHHLDPLDAASDAERDARLIAAGFAEVVRIPETWIWYDRKRVVATVREARRRNRPRQPASGC